MKKIFILFLLLPIFCFATTGISENKNSQGKWDIYYTAPSGKRFFIYEDQWQVSTTSVSGGDLFYQTNGNIFWIIFTCQRLDGTCVRFINLDTNQISKTFTNLAPIIDKDQNILGPLYNPKKQVVVLFNYPDDFSFTITPIFTTCNNPFKYRLPHLSDGPDVGSRFLPNGDLYLNISMYYGPTNQQATIPIDYKKLYANCQENS